MREGTEGGEGEGRGREGERDKPAAYLSGGLGVAAGRGCGLAWFLGLVGWVQVCRLQGLGGAACHCLLAPHARACSPSTAGGLAPLM